jgi:hypothetical protein
MPRSATFGALALSSWCVKAQQEDYTMTSPSIGKVCSKALLMLIATVPLLGMILVGCGNLLINYDGARIRDGYQIPIVEGDKKMGQFTSLDLTVDYQYVRKEDTLQISGKVLLADYLTRDSSLRYFNLSILLADADNNIIDSRPLTSAGYGGPIVFNKTLQLPREAKNMVFAFTYTGQTMGGGDGGGPWDFWEYPIIRGKK